jgi:hypothetical protein
MNAQLKKLQANVDAKTVTSVVVGMAVFGLITFAAIRTGISPVVAAAKAAKGA